MRTLFCVVALFLGCSVLRAEDKDVWKRYAPARAGFSVLLPSEPTTGSIPKKEPPIYFAGIKRKAEDSLSFQIHWSPREKSFESRDAAKAFVKGAREGALRVAKEKFNGKLIRSERITLGDLEGSEYVIYFSEGNVSRTRDFAGGKEVYSLTVFGNDEKAVGSPDAEKFFNSFQLSKTAEGKEAKGGK